MFPKVKDMHTLRSKCFDHLLSPPNKGMVQNFQRYNGRLGTEENSMEPFFMYFLERQWWYARAHRVSIACINGHVNVPTRARRVQAMHTSLFLSYYPRPQRSGTAYQYSIVGKRALNSSSTGDGGQLAAKY